MSKNTDPTPEQMDRINNAADTLAAFLGVDPDTVGTLNTKSIVLTVEQAEQIIELVEAAIRVA